MTDKNKKTTNSKNNDSNNNESSNRKSNATSSESDRHNLHQICCMNRKYYIGDNVTSKTATGLRFEIRFYRANAANADALQCKARYCEFAIACRLS